MEDSKDTVVIQNIKKDVKGPAFINFIQIAGEIKDDQESGQRMALMRPAHSTETKDGIVTFADKNSATNALAILNDTELGMKVCSPEKYFDRVDRSSCRIKRQRGENTAWWLWRCTQIDYTGLDTHGGRGGAGGKGGWGVFGRGQDGEPGENGPGGRGGRGGLGGGCRL